MIGFLFTQLSEHAILRRCAEFLDSRVRGNDRSGSFPTFYECIKAGYPQPKDEVVRGSYQLSELEVILKFEDLEGWKRSSRLCADLYKHFQDIIETLLLTTEN